MLIFKTGGDFVAIRFKKPKEEDVKVYGNENFGIPKDCTKKQRFSTAKLVFYLVAVAAICVTGYKYYSEIRDFILPEITYDKTKQPLIYNTPSGLIIKTTKGESYQLGKCADSDDIASVVKSANKGKTLFFLAQPDEKESRNLYTYSTDSRDVKIIDENVGDFKIDSEGKFVVYRKGSALYFSDLENTHPIHHNVNDYYLSKNNQVVTFFTHADTAMYTCDTKENEIPVLVDDNLTKVISKRDEHSVVYYIKNSNLYSKKYGNVSELIKTGVTDAIMLGDSVYFTTAETYTRPLDDFFIDYTAESDAAMEKPNGVNYMKEANGVSILDEEAFAKANENFRKKLLRDDIRKHFADTPPKTLGFSLYHYRDGEINKVDTDLSDPHLVYNSSRNIMVYKKNQSQLPDRYDIADLENLEQAIELCEITLGKTPDSDMYMVKEGKDPFFAFEIYPSLQIDISLDGKYLYCIESPNAESSGLLTRYDIGTNSLKNRIEICNNVTAFELDGSDSSAVIIFSGNSLSFYFDGKNTHLSDKSCHDFFFVDGTLFYFDNYDYSTHTGTLKTIRNNKITTIDKDVYAFNVRRYDYVSYIKDFNPDLKTGTLYTYNNGTIKKQDSHVASIIN